MNEKLEALAEEDPDLALTLLAHVAATKAEAYADVADRIQNIMDDGEEPSLADLRLYFMGLAEEEIDPYLPDSL